MPFKPGKSPADAAKNVGQVIEKITGDMSKSAVDALAYRVADEADHFVPVDTMDLQQSRRIVVNATASGWRATIGYYEPYAEYLYEDDTWQPRQSGDAGKRGAGVNLNAESRWIHKGLAKVDVQKFLANKMKL